MTSSKPTLGSILRNLRARESWTLKQMSEKCGIAISTLSKLEHDKLTLTYDKLQALAQRLGLRMSELFAEGEEPSPSAVTARRSIGRLADAVRVETTNYDYHYLCTDLRRKRMIPVIVKIRARTVKEFGELVRHSGEELLFVISGTMIVQTEFYSSIEVGPGETIYIDSSMGHAYLAAEGCDEVEAFAVMSNGEDELMETLFNLHRERETVDEPANENLTVATTQRGRKRR